MKRRRDQILGTIYGQAIGDAMGMPAELWPVETIRTQFTGGITTFLDGPSTNDIALNFTKGEYTDDTNQAFAVLDSLIETHWQPNQQNLAQHLLTWANSVGAWENNILGPSSLAALTAIKAGKDPRAITATALTNGAAMRIAPIGTLFEPSQLHDLVELVYEVSRVTHASDVAISGACLIAAAVTAAMADFDWEDIMAYALKANDLGYQLGAPTWAAKTHARTRLGLKLARQFADEPAAFSQAIYDVVGTGTMISESVPAAVAIAYYARDVKKAALLSANLGGDTDTIGAMATAICGAKVGLSAIDSAWRNMIDDQNPQHHIATYADHILSFDVN